MFRETNPVTVLVLIALVGAGFYGFHVAPLYLDNMEVKEACDEAFNAYIQQGEGPARHRLMIRLNVKNLVNEKVIGWHFAVDDDGVETIKPGLGLTDEQVTFDFDDQTRKLTVAVNYTRTVQFNPLKKRKTYRFSAQKSKVLQR